MPQSRVRLGQDNFTLEAREVPAALDPTFGQNGTLTYPTTPEFGIPFQTVTTTNGQFLSLTRDQTLYSWNSTDRPDFFVVRTNANGTLDTTYDGDGAISLTNLLLTHLGLPKTDSFIHLFPTELKPGPDGSWYAQIQTNWYTEIRLSAPTQKSQKDLNIIRFKSDGSLDTTFGNQGISSVRIDNGNVRTWSVGKDGSVYLLSTERSNDTLPYSSRVTRIDAQGNIDTSFGGENGLELKSIDLYRFSNLQFQTLADGSILVAGLEWDYSNTREDLWFPTSRLIATSTKFTPQGEVDRTYGTDGRVVWPDIPGITLPMLAKDPYNGGPEKLTPPILATTSSLLPQPDGSVIGILQQGAVSGPIWRATAGFSTSDLASRAADETPAYVPNFTPSAAFRILPNGQFDTNFGTNGIFTIDSQYFLGSQGIQILPDPKGGYLITATGNSGLVLQKLTAQGAPDSNFGPAGLAVLDAPFRIQNPLQTDQPVKGGPWGSFTTTFSYDPQGRLVAYGSFHRSGPQSEQKLFSTRIDLNLPTPQLPPLPNYPILEAQPVLPTPGVLQNVNLGGGGIYTVTFDPAQEDGNSPSKIMVSNFESSFELQPYEDTYKGGLIVDAADIDGDGVQELIVSPDVGGSSRIQVFKFDAGKFVQVANFFGIDDPNFRGGSRIALSDLNRDGKMDLFVSAGPGGGPRIAVYDGATLTTGPRKMMADFFAYEGEDNSRLTNGVSIATSHYDGDGIADLYIGAGPGGGPRLTVLSGSKLFNTGVEFARKSPFIDQFIGDNVDDRNGVALSRSINSWNNFVTVYATNRRTGEQKSFVPLEEGTERIIWKGQEITVRSGEWLLRVDGVTGTPDEQVSTIQTRLDDAGLTQIKAIRYLGIDGLVQVKVDGIPVDQVEQRLTVLPGYSYIEPNGFTTYVGF
ncbi:MAG: FG-GAP repeat domain-containing protein [Fimbriiglobus sp.]